MNSFLEKYNHDRNHVQNVKSVQLVKNPEMPTKISSIGCAQARGFRMGMAITKTAITTDSEFSFVNFELHNIFLSYLLAWKSFLATERFNFGTTNKIPCFMKTFEINERPDYSFTTGYRALKNDEMRVHAYTKPLSLCRTFKALIVQWFITSITSTISLPSAHLSFRIQILLISTYSDDFFP